MPLDEAATELTYPGERATGRARAVAIARRTDSLPPPCRSSTSTRTIFADQMKRGRKTATIRLGDKRHKYRKNQVVMVTVGYQYSPREKVFHAVIDNVEVKRVSELSPRDIEHDNPEFRRTEELVHFLEQIYGREVSLEDTVTVVRFSQIIENPPGLPGPPARRRRRPELTSGRRVPRRRGGAVFFWRIDALALRRGWPRPARVIAQHQSREPRGQQRAVAQLELRRSGPGGSSSCHERDRDDGRATP